MVLRDGLTIQDVVGATSRVTGVPQRDILSPHRGTPRACRARWLAMYVWYYHGAKPLKVSWTALGRLFDRDRTTVRHAVRRIGEDGGGGAYDAVAKVLKELEA